MIMWFPGVNIVLLELIHKNIMVSNYYVVHIKYNIICQRYHNKRKKGNRESEFFIIDDGTE